MKTDTAWSPGQATAPAIGPGMESQTAVPARPASLISDVLVPACQAIITGALLGAGLTWLIVTLGFSGQWLPLWGSLALLISTVAWLVLLVDHRKLLWAIETVTGLDLDRDGKRGRPISRPILHNPARGREARDRQDEDDDRERFRRFVQALPHGTGIRRWEPVIGREQYVTWRDALLDEGLARWKSTNKTTGQPNTGLGWELSLPVDEVLRCIE